MKFMCDVTHNYSFGLLLTAANEVCMCIIFIPDDIIFLLQMVIQYNVFDVKFSIIIRFFIKMVWLYFFHDVLYVRIR